MNLEGHFGLLETLLQTTALDWVHLAGVSVGAVETCIPAGLGGYYRDEIGALQWKKEMRIGNVTGHWLFVVHADLAI